MTREALLARTVVELADTLVDDFDIIDLLTTLIDRCMEILDISAAGIMLVTAERELRLITSSSEAMRLVELFELQSEEGPCPDCYRTGEAVVSADLVAERSRWPRFAPIAIDAGFLAVEALPMRLRRNVIGAFNVFQTRPRSLNVEDLVVAQALTDIATIGVLQHQASVSAHAVNEQLSQALSSRIVIEQAKGVVAERERLDMDGAFGRLRNHARNHNRRLVDVAGEIVDGTLSAGALDLPRPSEP
jgi:GAF domain-containing protein